MATRLDNYRIIANVLNNIYHDYLEKIPHKTHYLSNVNKIFYKLVQIAQFYFNDKRDRINHINTNNIIGGIIPSYYEPKYHNLLLTNKDNKIYYLGRQERKEIDNIYNINICMMFFDNIIMIKNNTEIYFILDSIIYLFISNEIIDSIEIDPIGSFSCSGRIMIDKTIYYDGHLVNGKYHGNGLLYNNGKLVYNGNWKNDERYDHGIEYDLDGNILYDGNWINNLRNGNGIGYEFVNHDFSKGIWPSYKGQWFDGERHGRGIEYNLIDGIIIYDGMWKNNFKHGDEYYPNTNNIKNIKWYKNHTITEIKDYIKKILVDDIILDLVNIIFVYTDFT